MLVERALEVEHQTDLQRGHYWLAVGALLVGPGRQRGQKRTGLPKGLRSESPLVPELPLDLPKDSKLVQQELAPLQQQGHPKDQRQKDLLE